MQDVCGSRRKQPWLVCQTSHWTVRTSNTVPSKNFAQLKEFKRHDNEEKLNNWGGKVMYRQHVRQIEDKGKSNKWKWLRKSNLKGWTEALICSAQEQSPRTNYMKFHIVKTDESPLCRICRVDNDTVSHIISECQMLP